MFIPGVSTSSRRIKPGARIGTMHPRNHVAISAAPVSPLSVSSFVRGDWCRFCDRRMKAGGLRWQSIPIPVQH